MLTISVMTEDDIEFAEYLTYLEKWAYTQDDFKRLIFFEPKGCFVAWKDKERVGIVTTTTYDDYAFIGTLIVKKEERGKGIGKELMNHAIEYLQQRGIKTIELDGELVAISLYKRLGFKDKYLSLRFNVKGGRYSDYSTLYDASMLDEIVNFDREKTGISRERVIKKLLEEFSESTIVIRNKNLVAYAVVRPRAEGFFTIGPFIADKSAAGENLLKSIIRKYSKQRLCIGVPEVNSEAIRMLLRYRFKSTEPSLRMYLGERKDYEKHIYGILSPEKG
ncbi:GNAT family N-acetyltransferase [candidate division WOR-3 bacterium]|nr:GNAT family N-acetyltransferase [candidate division WOR-3 bacterium]